MADADEKTGPDEGIEAWVTVELQPAPPGCIWSAFLVPDERTTTGFRVETLRVAFCALQHLTFEEDGADVVESRIVPVVIHPTGEVLYLDGGRGGGPDHGFAGVGNSSGEAEKIGEAVRDELARARGKR